MFLLNQQLAPPPRHRLTDDLVDFDSVAENVTNPFVYKVRVGRGRFSEIYDQKEPRYAWKNVWHKKEEHNPVTFTGTRTSFPCGNPNCWVYTNWCNEPSFATTYPEIIAHPEVQRAIKDVARRWYDKLYQIRPEQLPDMFVFMAELRELNGIFSIILGYARQIIALLRKIRNLKRWRDRQVRTLPKLNMNEKKRIYRDVNAAVGKISSDILSLRFGVNQPIRDFTKVVSAMFGYLDTFNFAPRTENVREIVKLHLTKGEFETSCQGGLYNCTTEPMHEAPIVEDIEVAVNCSVHFRNLLLGTKIEKLFAILLQQCGVMPSLDSFWELTRLSWLVDYFFATEKLLGRLERATSHCGFVQAIIFDSVISLKIKREVTSENSCARHGADIGAYYKATYQYYERVTGDGHDLLPLIQWVRTPGGNAAQNAISFLLQMVTRK